MVILLFILIFLMIDFVLLIKLMKDFEFHKNVVTSNFFKVSNDLLGLEATINDLLLKTDNEEMIQGDLEE